MSVSQTINGLQHYLPDTTDVEWGGILASYLHGLSYAKYGVIVFGVSSGIVVGTRYAAPGYDVALAAAVQMPVPCAAVLRLGYVRCRTTPAGGSVTVDVLKNGSNVMFDATVAAGATTATTTNSSFSFAAGDLLSVSVVGNAGYASGGADLTIALPWTAA